MVEEVATADLHGPTSAATAATARQAMEMSGMAAGGARAVDTTGDGVPDSIVMPMLPRAVDTTGDGVPDSLVTPMPAPPGIMPMATAVAMPQPQPPMAVQVPLGVIGGQMIAVTMNGATMQVQVPMGLREGQSFLVTAPAPSNPTPTAFATVGATFEKQLP